MFSRTQRKRIAILCLFSLSVNPSWIEAAGGGGGGFRGNSGHRSVGPSGGNISHSAPSSSSPHLSGTNTPHTPLGNHSQPSFHSSGIGGNHVVGVHGAPGNHFVGNIHQPGPHWNNYHQAYVGNHAVHLAWAGYRPSYYYHPWYHGPWGGHAWGWGWGFGPGLSFGLGLGLGVGLAAGWGYPAYYGPYGPYGYWGRPLGWGFGGWGLGTTVYTSGYTVYYNPYYIPGAYPTVYNYAQPIPVAIQAPPGAPPTDYDANSPSGAQPPQENIAFDMARESFKRSDYAAALRDVDAALRKSPTDAVMHEFRSLTLFAMRDYRQSAAVIHSVLAVGPGWDYTTMTSLYTDPFTYGEQLQVLEEYSREHPRAADAHFLLAYHDMIGSRKEAAIVELQNVIRLMPGDQLAGELLTMVQGPPKTDSINPLPSRSSDSFSDDPNTIPPSDSSGNPSIPAIDKTLLFGTWTASRDDGSRFRLTITDDDRFTWKFSPANQKGEEFSGTYSTDGPVLVLQRKEGGALAGTATFSSDNALNFKLVGGPPEDKGLDFGKL